MSAAAAATRLMARLRAQGLSYFAIAATLNKSGTTTPFGGRWYGATVRIALLAGSNPTTKKE